METAANRDIYSVSRLNREVRVLLERGFGSIWLEAEISNLAKPSSGHWYFSLKDATAQVRCCMFRQRNMLCTFAARDGQKVLVRARIGLYEPRGEYQLVIDHMEDSGLGALKRQFEELSAKLAAEGLFAPERKRALPMIPKRIGVITSPTGAAIRDILHVLARRFAAVPVLIYPVAVQGAAAAAEIAAAVRGQAVVPSAMCSFWRAAGARSRICGPSMMRRWPARSSPRPFPSSAALAMKLTLPLRISPPMSARRPRRQPPKSRCPTAKNGSPPCHAWAQRLQRGLRRRVESQRERLRWLIGRAALVSPSARLAERSQRLDDLEQRMSRGLRQILADRRSALGERRSRLWQRSPVAQLRSAAAKHAALFARLRAAAVARLHLAREHLSPLVRTLQAVSPLATLDRGYAIVSRVGGTIVRSAAEVSPGTPIDVRLAVGKFRAKVEES